MSNAIFDITNTPLASDTVPVIVFPDCLLIIEIVAYSSGWLSDLSNTFPDMLPFCFDCALTIMQRERCRIIIKNIDLL